MPGDAPPKLARRLVASIVVRGIPIDGERLRAAREAERMSVSILAALVDVEPGHLRLLERGQRLPSIELVGRLEEALAVTAAELGASLPERASMSIDGKKLRAARERRHLAVNDLAEQVKIGPRYLRLLEQGARQPSVGLVGRLEEALGVTASDLVADVADRLA